jgi:hypothetical protein
VQVDPFGLAHGNIKAYAATHRLDSFQTSCQGSRVGANKNYIIGVQADDEAESSAGKVSRRADLLPVNHQHFHAEVRQVCHLYTIFKQDDEHCWTEDTTLTNTPCHFKP